MNALLSMLGSALAWFLTRYLPTVHLAPLETLIGIELDTRVKYASEANAASPNQRPPSELLFFLFIAAAVLLLPFVVRGPRWTSPAEAAALLGAAIILFFRLFR